MRSALDAGRGLEDIQDALAAIRTLLRAKDATALFLVASAVCLLIVFRVIGRDNRTCFAGLPRGFFTTLIH